MNVALAMAQPIAAYFSRWSGKGVSEEERARLTSGPITPAPGTFAIWGPLFAESLRYAAWSAQREHRGDAVLRRAGWLTSATLASNSAWSVHAQLRGLGWPSTAIIALGASSATAALLDATHGAEHDDTASHAARSIAPLAGWLTLASFANLETTLNETRGRPAPRIEDGRALMLLGAATLTTGAVTVAAKGSPLYAGAVAWGLGGVLVRNVREGRGWIAAAAGAGIGALVATALIARKPAVRAKTHRRGHLAAAAGP